MENLLKNSGGGKLSGAAIAGIFALVIIFVIIVIVSLIYVTASDEETDNAEAAVEYDELVKQSEQPTQYSPAPTVDAVVTPVVVAPVVDAVVAPVVDAVVAPVVDAVVAPVVDVIAPGKWELASTPAFPTGMSSGKMLYDKYYSRFYASVNDSSSPIMISTAGDQWVSQSFPHEVHVAGGSYALGSSHTGKLMYADMSSYISGGADSVYITTDGGNWRKVTTPTASDGAVINCVAYENNTWILGGHNGRTPNQQPRLWLSNDDGLTWLMVRSPELAISALGTSISKVEYVKFLGRYFALCGSTATTGDIISSADTRSWAIASDTMNIGTGPTIRDLAVAEDKQIMVAIINRHSQFLLSWSTDGKSWNNVSVANGGISAQPGNNYLSTLTYGNGKFVAMVDGGVGQYLESSDGKYFELKGGLPSGPFIRSLAYSDKLNTFVAGWSKNGESLNERNQLIYKKGASMSGFESMVAGSVKHKPNMFAVAQKLVAQKLGW